MTLGRDALHEIDMAIAEARRGLARSSDAAASDARLFADLDQRQIGVFQRLAEMRLVELKDGAASGGGLGIVDLEARALMAKHDGALAEIAAGRDAAARDLERLEVERAATERAVAEAIEAHDAAAAQTRARLEQDGAWRAKADALEDLNAMAARAGQKLAIAREDRTTKGAIYESDPLFQYLRMRKFGTRDYRVFPLFAALDGWVAGLIKYRDHRLNFERLVEIPERLSDHVERLKKGAAEMMAALEALEREAMDADGVDRLRDDAASARAQVDALDAAIAKSEEAHRALSERFAAAAAGNAGPLGKARDLIAGALAKAAIPDLRILAAETASPEDDLLVESLISMHRQRMEIEEGRRTASAALNRKARSLADLESLRRRFKSARFDSPYSEFPGRDVINVLLSEYFRGSLDRDDLWRRLERSHKTRRRDWDNDLGGDDWRGGFGLPNNWGGTMGDGWGDAGSGGAEIRRPTGVRAPRPPRVPRMPSPPASRGGFRTTRKF